MTVKIRISFPTDDEAMRTEHGERTVLPPRHSYDPAIDCDRGPHVDRVGLIAVDTDPDHEDGK